jgi:hypothetical protein
VLSKWETFLITFLSDPFPSVGLPFCGLIAVQSGGPERLKKSLIHLLFPPAFETFRARRPGSFQVDVDPVDNFESTSTGVRVRLRRGLPEAADSTLEPHRDGLPSS